MARLPYLSPEDLPEEQRNLLARPIALNRILVHAPEGARAFWRLGGWIRNDAKLDPRLRELAILEVGWLAKSAYEWSHHVKLGLEFGVSEADIRGLMAWNRGERHGLDTKTQLVLQAACEMTADSGMTADTFAAVDAAFGHEQAVELSIIVAFYCGVVRFLATLAIDVEPEYQPYLDRFPLD